MATSKARGGAPIPESASAPAYQVIDDVFVWSVPDGDDVRVTLRLKMKTLRSLADFAKDEAASEMDQFFELLRLLGDERMIAQVDEMWMEDAFEMIGAFFEEFAKKHRAPVGE